MLQANSRLWSYCAFNARPSRKSALNMFMYLSTSFLLRSFVIKSARSDVPNMLGKSKRLHNIVPSTTVRWLDPNISATRVAAPAPV